MQPMPNPVGLLSEVVAEGSDLMNALNAETDPRKRACLWTDLVSLDFELAAHVEQPNIHRSDRDVIGSLRDRIHHAIPPAVFQYEAALRETGSRTINVEQKNAVIQSGMEFTFAPTPLLYVATRILPSLVVGALDATTPARSAVAFAQALLNEIEKVDSSSVCGVVLKNATPPVDLGASS